MTTAPNISDTQAQRIVEMLMEKHKTIQLYPSCGHIHEKGDEGIVYVPGISWTCAQPFDYCEYCCERASCGGDEVSDYCADHHVHKAGRPACSVWEAILAVTSGAEAEK